jgi:hypothetical protein
MIRSGSGVSPVLSERGGGWLAAAAAAAGDPGTLSKKREARERETRKGERSRGERFGSVLITVVVI